MMKKFTFKLLTILICLIISMTFLPVKANALSLPSAPTGLTAKVTGFDQINLTWNPVSDATQYYIYRGNSLSGTYTYVGAVTTPNYNDTGLTAATPYYYKVQAINSVGSSDYSTEAWATTLSASSSGGTVSFVGSDRLAGDDRYETSAKIAQAGWKTSYYAILASGENFPDALCAAPLASKYNAPILLTSTDRLEDSTKNELSSLNVKNVIMIGGEGVLTGNVEQAIKNLGINVTRIAGQDRYETSMDVAKMLGNFDKAVIATGVDFPDVLSIAPIAAQKGIPILLTPKDSLSNSLKEYLNLKVQKTYVLGDSSVVSDTVVEQLPSPQRLSGSDRYEDNIQIINAFENDLDLSSIYVATGDSFPDALSGSALAALTKSPVILVSNTLNQTTTNFLQSKSTILKKVTAFGGTGVVSDSLLNSIAPGTGSNNSALSTPTNVVATSLNSNQIYLTWNSVSNATAYNVYRATSYSGTYSNVASVSTPYYSDAYLSPGTTYYYKVQALNSTGSGGYSDIIYSTTLSSNETSLIPTNLVATSLSSSQVYLTWSIVSNATSYNIYRATSYSGTYTNIGTVNTSNYTDTYLPSGVTYYYKVQAVNSTGTSAYSDIVSVTTLSSNSALSIPANVTATTLNTNQINLTWDTVSNATYYNIYRSTSYAGTYSIIGSVYTPYYSDNSLTTGITYYYKIQAMNTTGSSAFSSIVNATTLLDSATLSPPSNPVATGLSSNEIYLTWNAVSTATYYNVYRSTSSLGTYELVASVSTPYYPDNNLSSGTTYFYKVQAVNSVGKSDYSNIAYATTMYGRSSLATPSNVLATMLSTSQIYLTWDSVSNATYYNVLRSTSSSGTYTIVASVSNPYYADNSLSSGTTYYYKIQACNSVTTSSQSSIVYCTTSK
ncbi:cell wall-binding repeat-containing protein [Desulfitobacterium sp. Sab5]|uniref:cell wall-binding repeat-containing protein n=1 Tax=Desulfitobacterium nosdiversum TaxID=3375356 RepID=UPI003CEA2E63